MIQMTHRRRNTPVVTLGLEPRVQGQTVRHLPWMLGSSPSMTVGEVAMALRSGETKREKSHG
jgi:hypothetical protein